MNKIAVKNQDRAANSVKKYEARMLYVVKKQTAKEISTLIDVSEKSVGRWIKKYGWKEDRDKPLNGNIAIDEFIQYLQAKNPMLSIQYRMYALDYYKHLKNIKQ